MRQNQNQSVLLTYVFPPFKSVFSLSKGSLGWYVLGLVPLFAFSCLFYFQAQELEGFFEGIWLGFTGYASLLASYAKAGIPEWSWDYFLGSWEQILADHWQMILGGVHFFSHYLWLTLELVVCVGVCFFFLPISLGAITAEVFSSLQEREEGDSFQHFWGYIRRAPAIWSAMFFAFFQTALICLGIVVMGGLPILFSFVLLYKGVGKGVGYLFLGGVGLVFALFLLRYLLSMSLFIPSIFVEKQSGFFSLLRSKTLTSGALGKVVAVLGGYGGILAVLQLGLSWAEEVWAFAGFGYFLFSWLLWAVGGIFILAALSVLFHRLKLEKETFQRERINMAEILLDVRGLKTYFHTEEGVVKAVDGVDFSLKKGQTLGIVGESGCGKSVTSMSIMQLLPVPPAQYVAGSILFKGKDLLQLSGEEMRQIRGREISMIFQEPMTSLNPVYKVGDQIIEALLRQPGMDKASARQRAIELLEEVGISDAKLRVDNYPHQMSGGMKQRVMIAMALASQPDLLIADEPTTALDVTIQAQILDLMRSLQKKYHMSIMLITHDLGVVAEMADEVVVMYAGKVVERGDVETIFLRPRHPYTMGLFRSLPKLGEQKEVLDEIPGVVPNPLDFPQGCKFRTRCPFAVEKCFVEPSLEKVGEGHFASCWRLEEELEWPSELSAQRSAKPSDE